MSHVRRLRWLTIAAAIIVVGFFALRDQAFWAPLAPGRVKAVPEGAQEIAWLAPATSGDTWERVVKAVRVLAQQWAQTHGGEPLLLDTERAFLPLTADVPEVGLRFPKSGTLWIRWYKLSGSNNSAHWIADLQRRATVPLAIVGGDTSDRALTLAENMQRSQGEWPGAPPLLLITTATAERYLPPGKPELELHNDDWPRLMAVYPERSFRFAFTNTRMVEAVLDFVRNRSDVWPPRAKNDVNPASPFFLFTLTWMDDGYSKDLAYSFRKLFAAPIKAKLGNDAYIPFDENFVQYSVGDFFQPNPSEDRAVGMFLADSPRRGDQPQLLVLPTGAQRARRLLRTLCRRAPSEVRDIVVANGDSISFNNLYRDRDLAWNVQDVPVPLIGFSHRDPIDPSSGFGAKEPGGERIDHTSTQDLLLFRDLIEAVVLASFHDGALVKSADAVLGRLRGVVWRSTNIYPGPSGAGSTPFFDAEGNRTAGTGEHIIWLKPIFEGARVLPQATLNVFRLDLQAGAASWQQVGQPLNVFYDRSREQGAVHDGR
jgi:hypothetical protein